MASSIPHRMATPHDKDSSKPQFHCLNSILVPRGSSRSLIMIHHVVAVVSLRTSTASTTGDVFVSQPRFSLDLEFLSCLDHV